MQRPFIHPYVYSIIILLFTIVTATVFILLLLLSFCYCYYYKTVATNKLLRASLFPGAAELTTHLLRFINIFWLPLCWINKFGFYFSRRLLWSPIFVGHQCSNICKMFATVPLNMQNVRTLKPFSRRCGRDSHAVYKALWWRFRLVLILELETLVARISYVICMYLIVMYYFPN
jgi:hypothetical protein